MNTATDSVERLPPGRHGIPPEVVVENQRGRILAAVCQSHRELGYAGMSVGDISARAGVSRATFYKLFENKVQCVAAAQRDAADELRAEILQAWALHLEWPDRVDAALGVLLAFAAQAPERAFLFLSDAFIAEPDLAQAPIAFQSFLVDLLGSGGDRVPDLDSVSRITGGALVGAIRSLIASRILAGREVDLLEMKPDLVLFVLTPYLGPRDAVRFALRQA
jgi:AcrR family transcriptional regulator